MPRWAIPAGVAFGAIAVLGGVAYYLERSKRELDWAVTEAFKEGGWLAGFSFSTLGGGALSKNPKGIVTEGSPEDFTVNGKFAPTAAQALRSKPREV